MSDRMDPKLRELTYRLIAMAPDAPPFPEESMVQLKPSPAPARRRNALVWVAAAAAIALVIVGVPLMLFGGGDDPTPTIPPASVTTVPDVTPTTVPDVTPTTVPPVDGVTVPFTVYLFSDELTTRLGDPALVAVQRAQVVDAATQINDRLRVALSVHSLLGSPAEPGFTTAIPAGSELVFGDQSGGDGVVVVDVPGAFESGGGTASMTARLAQVVFTATQFSEVDSVLFTRDGVPIEVFSGEGLILDGPQTRADYYASDQLIYVDSPSIGSTVGSPFVITGDSNTFEATVEYEVTTDDGTVLDSGFTTATCGSGCWGQFTIEASYTLGADSAGFVTVFETSAEDGRRQHVLRYPVTLLASDSTTTGPAPSYLSAGFEPMRGAGYYAGRIVVESPLRVVGGSDADATVTVNGIDVALDENGGFTTDVELVDGENTIVVAATRGGQTIGETLIVRYVSDASIEFAYLTEVGASEIVADYAQWLTGDEANQAAFEDGEIGSIDEGVPNDYYIRNVNDQLRTLPLGEGVGAVLIDATGDLVPIEVPLVEWLALFKPDGAPWDFGDEIPDFPEPYFGYYGASIAGTPYWLILDADGMVIQIEQQYIP